MAPPRTLRDYQVAAIKRILNLNEEDPADANDSSANGQGSKLAATKKDPIWKILIFDDLGRDIISSVLKVSDLRSRGVTTHLHIKSQRYTIPDVPALYLVMPTTENYQLIASDLTRQLYDSTYINFLSTVRDADLRSFGSMITPIDNNVYIKQLFDHHLSFTVNEPNLFSLDMKKDFFYAFNSDKATLEDSDKMLNSMVEGLFSVAVNMGAIPIIRCPNSESSAAKQLAKKLGDKFHQQTGAMAQLFPRQVKSSPPVMIIVDRTIDLVPMLSHSWTYQSLVNDVLDLRLNRITVEIPVDDNNPAKGTTKKHYDLDPNDFFWKQNAGEPFPQIAENLVTALKEWQAESDQLTSESEATRSQYAQSEGSSAQKLKDALDKLPKLRERKAILDMHMNIATALSKSIKDRQLDNYFELEENITTRSAEQMLEIIRDSDKGSEPADKLRLFIIWYLSLQSNEKENGKADLTPGEMKRFEEALTQAGVSDLSALTYVQRVLAILRMTATTTASSEPPKKLQPSGAWGFSALSESITGQIANAGIGAGLGTLISGLKNLGASKKDLALTKITASIMGKSSAAAAQTEKYFYLDKRPTWAIHPDMWVQQPDGTKKPRPIYNFDEAIVFTIGGGSMDEYGNLQAWANPVDQARNPLPTKTRVVYGSTELLNASEFLEKCLGPLGREG